MGRTGKIPLVLFLAVALTVCGLTFLSPLRIEGDSLEYIVQTQAIVLDGALSVDPSARAEYWNRTAPFGERLQPDVLPASPASMEQSGGGFGGLYADARGAFRYYHFFAYSLLVAPIYLLLHLLDTSGQLEYHSFRVFNVLTFLPVLVLLWRRSGSLTARVAVASLLCTPLVPYLRWAHPETALFSAVSGAFLLAPHRLGPVAAPVLLGLATAQVSPIGLFFLPLGLLTYRKDLVTHAFGYSAGLLLALAPFAYFYSTLGVANPIAALGFADPNFASLERLRHFFFSPMIGAVWFFPLVFLLPFTTNQKAYVPHTLLLGTAVGAAWLACSTSNFNSAQIGCLRYAVWIVAPLVTHGVIVATDSWRSFVYLAAGGFLVFLFGTTPLALGWDDRFRNGERAALPATTLYRKTGYREEAETFVENVTGREIRSSSEFNGVYILDLGGERRQWIVTRRALRDMKFCSWSNDSNFSYRSEPASDLFKESESRMGLDATVADRAAAHPVFGGYFSVISNGPVADFRCSVPTVRR